MDMTAEQGPADQAAARAIPDELLLKAMRPFDNRLTVRQISQLRAALVAVADDLRAEGRRECAAELHALSRESMSARERVLRERALADSWESR